MNAPERFTSWRWDDEDEGQKLQFIPDTKMPNAGLFVLGKEDHTMGNLIRIQLLRDTSVRFAGYRVPHPLVNDCHIRVQTMSQKSTPKNVFLAAVDDLLTETGTIKDKFKEAIDAYERGEGM